MPDRLESRLGALLFRAADRDDFVHADQMVIRIKRARARALHRRLAVVAAGILTVVVIASASALSWPVGGPGTGPAAPASAPPTATASPTRPPAVACPARRDLLFWPQLGYLKEYDEMVPYVPVAGLVCQYPDMATEGDPVVSQTVPLDPGQIVAARQALNALSEFGAVDGVRLERRGLGELRWCVPNHRFPVIAVILVRPDGVVDTITVNYDMCYQVASIRFVGPRLASEDLLTFLGSVLGIRSFPCWPDRPAC